MELLHRGALVALAAEAPTPDLVARYGTPPEIYSAEINHWLWTVAVDLLRTRPDLGVLYVHTTDYPMHRWAPEASESLAHLARLDALLGEARAHRRHPEHPRESSAQGLLGAPLPRAR